jgi:hypothetical protein
MSSEVVQFIVERNATELQKVEALVAALARQMNATREDAAKTIRALETQRRRPDKAGTDVRARISVGPARAREIEILLGKLNWRLRDTVDSKLPLLKLPKDIKDHVRSGRLEPSKAIILGRIRSEAKRLEALEMVLERKVGVRALKSKRATPQVSSFEEQQQEDVKALEHHIGRELGQRVEVRGAALTIHFATETDLLDWLEHTVGIRPF